MTECFYRPQGFVISEQSIHINTNISLAKIHLRINWGGEEKKMCCAEVVQCCVAQIPL